MIARRFSAPSSRSTKRAIISRLVASSWIEISTWSPAARSSSHACTELSHCSPARPAPPAADGACGAWPACAVASTGRPPASRHAACPDSPAGRSSSPGARQAGSARSPGTAVSSRPQAPVPEARVAARGSTAAPAVRESPPHPPSASNFRRSRRKCRGVTPIRSAPTAAASQPSPTCLSTETRSLSFRLKSICIPLGSGSVVDRTPSDSLTGDISKSARHRVEGVSRGRLSRAPVCGPVLLP